MLPRLVVVLVALAVFPLVVLTALRITANDWIVHLEVDHGGLPRDQHGMDNSERLRLGLLGLRSIEPGGRGVALLEEARLEDGTTAFGPRELAHMQDVRDVFGAAMRLQLLLAVGFVALALGLAWRSQTRELVPRGLIAGCKVAGVLAAALVLLMVITWGRFFEGFHALFFSGDSWRFYRDDTLIRVYPDRFWMGVAAAITVLSVLGFIVVFLAGRFWLARLRR